MNSSYFADISLVTYDESQYVPEKVIQSSGHIRGWIDIVGFRNVLKKNATYYINGSPADKAMIKYDAWGTVSLIDSLTKTASVYSSGDNTNAKMDVVLKWHYYYSCNCGEDGCSTCRKDVKEQATFYDYEPSPIQYPTPDNTSIIVHEYKEKKVIYLNISKWSTGYDLTSQNGSVSEIKAGNLKHTSKGVPYVNFTAPQVVTNLSGKMNRFGVGYMVENTSFNTRFYTPYAEVNLSQNITIIKHESTSIQPFMFYFVFIVAVILFGIKRMVSLCRI